MASTALKLGIGIPLLLAVAIGGELAYLHHRNAVDNTVAPEAVYKTDPDDLVFLKAEHPMSLKDENDLKGRTVWVNAGGQLDYYAYAGHKVDYAHTQGVLLGGEPLMITDAVEQVAPKSAAFRIPQGDKQVLLVFTKPNETRQYAVPVGFVEKGDYTLDTDTIFFYDDPRKLYSYWGPQVWAAIDAHQAILGMSERQAQMALGQTGKNHGETYGNRMVEYDDQGHPKMITFVHNKATKIEDVQQ